MTIVGCILTDGRRVLIPIMHEGDDWWSNLLEDYNVEDIETVHYVPEDMPFIMNGERWK